MKGQPALHCAMPGRLQSVGNVFDLQQGGNSKARHHDRPGSGSEADGLWGCGAVGWAGPRPCLDVFITDLGLEACEQPADGNSRCGCGSQVGLGPGRGHKLLVAAERRREGQGTRARAGRASSWKTERSAPGGTC